MVKNAGVKQTSPVSSLRVAGHCCQGAVAFQQPRACQTVQARAKRRLENSHGYCCAVTGLFFGDCSNERVSPLRGTSWDAFIGDGKHAEKFAAVISLVEEAANNSRFRSRSVCCGRSARARQKAS